jgi:hypothetical protein
MAKGVRAAWARKDKPVEESERTRAVEVVNEKNERDRRNLRELQGREIKQLESERVWIEKERARDLSTFNEKEITAINQRYDRLDHDMARRNNTFFAKLHRVIGGHKSQKARVDRLTAERNKIVGERTKQHVDREGQRQRSLTERDGRVAKDLQEAHERHGQAQDNFRQQREQGFELSVRHEINRARVEQEQQQPKMRM